MISLVFFHRLLSFFFLAEGRGQEKIAQLAMKRNREWTEPGEGEKTSSYRAFVIIRVTVLDCHWQYFRPFLMQILL